MTPVLCPLCIFLNVDKRPPDLARSLSQLNSPLPISDDQAYLPQNALRCPMLSPLFPHATPPSPTQPVDTAGGARLRGRRDVALVLADDGDAAVGARAIGALRAAEGQHAVGGQRAANGGLVHA